MRSIVPVLLAACTPTSWATPPKAGQLSAPTCTIRGGQAAGVSPRWRGKPIAMFDEYGFERVTLSANAGGATVAFANAAHTYFGDAALADVHVTLRKPLAHGGWLVVSDAKVARIEGATAILDVGDPAIQLASPVSFTAACSDLTLGRTLPPIEKTALAPNQTFALYDAPNGARVATVTLGESDQCGAGRLEARVLEDAGSFHRLRIPTRFGAIEAWTDTARVIPSEGQPLCGATSSPNAYLVDTARVCPRDVPIYAHDGRTSVQVGLVHVGADINVVEVSPGEGVLVAAGATRAPTENAATLRPFVRLADVERCPTRARVDRR